MMRQIRSNLKWISVVLIFLISLQSCTVYHSSTASVEEAIRSENKVKIKSPDYETYNFVKLQKINDELYGYAKRESETSRLLSSRITPKYSDKKNVSILLSDELIQTIHLKNKSASTAISVAIPVVGLGAAIGIFYATYDPF